MFTFPGTFYQEVNIKHFKICINKKTAASFGKNFS